MRVIGAGANGRAGLRNAGMKDIVLLRALLFSGAAFTPEMRQIFILCRIRLPLRRIPIASYPMQMPSWAINGSLPMITARSRKRHPGSWREGRAEQARAVIICCMPAENGNKEKVYAVF